MQGLRRIAGVTAQGDLHGERLVVDRDSGPAVRMTAHDIAPPEPHGDRALHL